MTTIAFDGRYLAADTLTHRHNTPSNMLQPKITVEGGFAYAVGGLWCAMVHDLIRWHEKGADPAEMPKADNGSMLVVELSSRRVWCVIHALPYLDEEGPPFTVGSGGDYALGAIDAGLNAMEAVRIASKRDLHTNDTIDFVDLEWAEKGVQRWDGGMPTTRCPMPVRCTNGMPLREVVAMDTEKVAACRGSYALGTPCGRCHRCVLEVAQNPLYRVDTDEEGNNRVTLAQEVAHVPQVERAGVIGKADICMHGYVRVTCSRCIHEVAAAIEAVRHS